MRFFHNIIDRSIRTVDTKNLCFCVFKNLKKYFSIPPSVEESTTFKALAHFLDINTKYRTPLCDLTISISESQFQVMTR